MRSTGAGRWCVPTAGSIVAPFTSSPIITTCGTWKGKSGAPAVNEKRKKRARTGVKKGNRRIFTEKSS